MKEPRTKGQVEETEEQSKREKGNLREWNHGSQGWRRKEGTAVLPLCREAKITTQSAPLAWQDSVIASHTQNSFNAMLGTRDQQIEE